jgi:hypothetical protein
MVCEIPWWLFDEEIAKQPVWRREGLKIYRDALSRSEWLDPDVVEKSLAPGEKLCGDCEGYGYLHPKSDGTMNPCSICKAAGKI